MSEETALPRMEAKVRLYHDATGQAELLGFAELVIASAFVIKGIRILLAKPREDRPGGPFISFPSRRGNGASQDRYFEVAHPITASAREAARDLVLKTYEEEAGKARGREESRNAP